MTMDLTRGAFFSAYLRALNSRQLDALRGWQDSRLADSPCEDVVLDATRKKRTIYLEQKRRSENVLQT